MPSVYKDILYPGVFTLANGERWECTPGAVRNAAVVGNRMLQAGNVAAPLIWEHDLNSDPAPVSTLLSMIANPRQWAGDMAKNTFGYAERYNLETVKGDPVACAELRIPDEADVRQFGKTRFVSARVNHNHTDPGGRFWPGWSIGHIAATPIPIQQRQRPVMLSHAPAVGRRSWCSVFLSREYREGEPMGDENADKGKKKGEPGESGSISELITELSNAGVNIPDGVTDLPGVILCVKTFNANKGNAGGGADLDDDGLGDDGATPVTGGGMPALLSALPDDASRDAYRTSVHNSRAGLLGRLRRVEGKAVKDGHWTAADAQRMKKTIEDMDGVKLLSAVHKGGQASRVVREIELVERHYGLKAPPPGVEPKPSKQLSGNGTPPGARGVETPKLGGEGTPSEQIAEARKRAVDRIKSGNGSAAATAAT